MPDFAEHFAHVLLFECPTCGRPLASACASNSKNLEVADAHWFTPHCLCGWTGDVVGIRATKHWVVPWHPLDGKGPLPAEGSCDARLTLSQP